MFCGITKYRDGLVQWLEPPMSVAVAQSIGAVNAITFDLSNARAGMLTGVFVLANRIRRGQIRYGMVASGEYISELGVYAAAHIKNIVSRELASLTLADAGAAVIVERAPTRSRGIEIAQVAFLRGRNVLQVHEQPAFGERAAARVGQVTATPLADLGVDRGDIDLVIPAPDGRLPCRAPR